MRKETRPVFIISRYLACALASKEGFSKKVEYFVETYLELDEIFDIRGSIQNDTFKYCWGATWEEDHA